MSKNQQKTLGNIHSFESFGTLDGPGIRFVVFLAGCPLRCKYCHNIDVVYAKNAPQITAEELVQKILVNKPYFDASGGGVTVSGGDPVSQPEFLVEFLRLCQEHNLHTAVDTSLCAPSHVIEQIAEYTDLFLISLKHMDDKIHQYLTGASNRLIFRNIEQLSKMQKRIWFRLIILPGYTDTKQNLTELTEYLKTVDFELIELLPYHEMGIYKWKELGLGYDLKDVSPPTPKQIAKVKNYLSDAGFTVVVNE